MYSVNNFSSKKTSIDCSREGHIIAIKLFLSVYVMPLCIMAPRYASLHYPFKV